MHGNVSEWCRDWKEEYPSSIVKDPIGKGDSFRVIRGGNWNCQAKRCRSAKRDSGYPGNKAIDCGFRVALVPID